MKMKVFGLPLQLAVGLYVEKCDAIRRGDLDKLLNLKKHFPDLFLKQEDERMHSILDCIKSLSICPYFQAFCKRLVETQLSIVYNGIETEIV